ncbi:MAG: PTS sugar transporter subunit IIB [Deltaproteobacteria bacterium]|jgi:PTS system mannose-specific IIB component|nr:PTS sugar transporter subunit IIB [Deltaproteobacteria bacterium]
MPIILARIDERLIHGQVMTSEALVRHKINGIIIADRNLVNDPTSQAIFNASVLTSDYDIPDGSQYTEPERLHFFLKEKDLPKHRFLVLFRNMAGVLSAIENGVILNSLNLGNFISIDPLKKELTRSFQVGHTESEELKKLHWLIGEMYFNDLGNPNTPYSPQKHAWENK